MRDIKIAPSLLSADFSKLGEQVQLIKNADMLHLDVMDGHFVPNITFGPLVVRDLRKHTDLEFDLHLMIENPDQYIPKFAEAGANSITVHAEACTHLHRTIQVIKNTGCKASVSINPHTPVNAIESILPELDMVLVMSVNPGFGGQAFIPSILSKVEQLRAMSDIDIQIDGGIKVETAPLAAKAGANVLVAGSAVFGKDDPAQAIQELRNAVKFIDKVTL